MLAHKNFIALICGILGMALMLSAWHIYEDHRNLHALVSLVEQNQKAQPKMEQK